MNSREREIADLVRKKCIEAAKEGFTDASLDGLCAEGAMESAISAMQSLDLERLIQESGQ